LKPPHSMPIVGIPALPAASASLFQYVDENGAPLGGRERLLREIAGEEITAKDSRTWAGTNLAALASRELEALDTEANAKRKVGGSCVGSTRYVRFR